MSVMFQALRKAANDHRLSRLRAQPLDEPPVSVVHGGSPVLLPWVALSPQKPLLRLLGVAIVAFVIGAGSAVAAFLLFDQPDQTGAAPKTVAEAPPVHHAPVKAPHAKRLSQEPPGIALPAESLMPVPEMDAVEKQLEAMPVLPVEKNEPQHVVMSEAESDSDRLLFEAQKMLEAKNYAGAIVRYDTVLAHDGDNAAAWAGEVYALQQSGTPESLNELQHIAASRPALASAQAALAALFWERGEKEAALAAAKRAVEIEPANAPYRLSLAVLHDRLGQHAEALAQYRKMPKPVEPSVQKRIAYLSVLETPSPED